MIIRYQRFLEAQHTKRVIPRLLRGKHVDKRQLGPWLAKNFDVDLALELIELSAAYPLEKDLQLDLLAPDFDPRHWVLSPQEVKALWDQYRPPRFNELAAIRLRRAKLISNQEFCACFSDTMFYSGQCYLACDDLEELDNWVDDWTLKFLEGNEDFQPGGNYDWNLSSLWDDLDPKSKEDIREYCLLKELSVNIDHEDLELTNYPLKEQTLQFKPLKKWNTTAPELYVYLSPEIAEGNEMGFFVKENAQEGGIWLPFLDVLLANKKDNLADLSDQLKWAADDAYNDEEYSAVWKHAKAAVEEKFGAWLQAQLPAGPNANRWIYLFELSNVIDWEDELEARLEEHYTENEAVDYETEEFGSFLSMIREFDLKESTTVNYDYVSGGGYRDEYFNDHFRERLDW